MLRSEVNSLQGNPCDQSWRRKEGYGGKDLQKSKVLSLEWRSEGWWSTTNVSSMTTVKNSTVKCFAQLVSREHRLRNDLTVSSGALNSTPSIHPSIESWTSLYACRSLASWHDAVFARNEDHSLLCVCAQHSVRCDSDLSTLSCNQLVAARSVLPLARFAAQLPSFS